MHHPNETPQDLMLKSVVCMLERELALYGDLGARLAVQRDALVRLDHARLEAVTAELDALVEEVRRTTSARERMVREAATALGRKGESLRDLVEAVPEPWRARMAELRRDLLGAVKRMRGLAALSRTLVEDSLGHVRTFVRVLAGMAGPPPVYASPRPGAPALVDRSA